MLLFNVERLDIREESVVNLASFVYVLAAATAALFLLVPLRRQHVLVVSVGVLGTYVALKLLAPSPILAGVHKYLTITEITSLSLIIILGWLASQAMHDFEGAVEAISLPSGGTHALSYREFRKQVRAELKRARRSQTSLSIAMLNLDPQTFDTALHQAAREAQSAMVKRYVQRRFGSFLKRCTRESDVFSHQIKGGDFALLAPNTTAAQAAHVLERLARQAEVQTGIRFHYSVADFPDAALTSDELLDTAIERIRVKPAQLEPIEHSNETSRLDVQDHTATQHVTGQSPSSNGSNHASDNANVVEANNAQ
jgi:GGDEF domain-containing protein